MFGRPWCFRAAVVMCLVNIFGAGIKCPEPRRTGGPLDLLARQHYLNKTFTLSLPHCTLGLDPIKMINNKYHIHTRYNVIALILI